MQAQQELKFSKQCYIDINEGWAFKQYFFTQTFPVSIPESISIYAAFKDFNQPFIHLKPYFGNIQGLWLHKCSILVPE